MHEKGTLIGCLWFFTVISNEAKRSEKSFECWQLISKDFSPSFFGFEMTDLFILFQVIQLQTLVYFGIRDLNINFGLTEIKCLFYRKFYSVNGLEFCSG